MSGKTDFAVLFQDFWEHGGQYIVKTNQKRMLNNTKKALTKCENTLEIDDYVDRLKSAKETVRRLIVAFYDYLERKKNITIDSNLRNLKYYDYPFQRQLEIAKFLQEPHTRTEIMDHFAITERTMRQDLQALSDGIEVLGAKIQIETSKKGRKLQYHTSMHPVFLPLNLTEVYAMTVYLDHVLQNDPNADIIRTISKRIKGQLSDYAYQRLFPDEAGRIENRYIDDQEMAHSREGILMYLMKSGQTCSFYLDGQKVKGRIRYGSDGYQVQLEDGTVIDKDPREVEFVLEDLEYR